MNNKAIISIGSNSDRSSNVKKVIEMLQANFPGSRFSTPEITEPIDLPEGAKAFLNLVAMIPTILEKEQFIQEMKILEMHFGRDPEDEEEGLVPMDLDLIEWNDEVVKPHDFLRSYVVQGLEEIDEF